MDATQQKPGIDAVVDKYRADLQANGYSDELIKSILEELLNADEEERGGRKRRGSRLLTRRSQSTKPKDGPAQGINEEEVKVEVDGGSRGAAGGCGCTVS